MNNIKRMLKILVVAASLATALPLLAATYDIDPSHSSVDFKIKHLAISNVKGAFTRFEGSFEFTPGKTNTWETEVTIQIASIDTGDKKRDEHLRSPEFFDAEKIPTMVFKSTGVRMKDEEEGELSGTLTMHGITLPVTLDLEVGGVVTDPWGNERAGFSATGKINRKDWGLTYGQIMEGGGLLIGDQVKITLEVEGIKRK